MIQDIGNVDHIVLIVYGRTISSFRPGIDVTFGVGLFTSFLTYRLMKKRWLM